MSRNLILKEIKQAEAAAKIKLEKAEEDRKIALANARRKAVEDIQKAEVSAREKYEKGISSTEAKMNEEKEKHMTKGADEAEKIEKKSSANIQKAKKHLFEEFERTINVSS